MNNIVQNANCYILVRANISNYICLSESILSILSATKKKKKNKTEGEWL